MDRVKLTSYNSSYFDVLQSWITDQYVLLQYSGTHFHFPFSETQMDTYVKEYPERKLYMGLLDERIPFAFGEIIPQDHSSVRLARILIGDPGLRGQGLGKAFIKALIAEAKTISNPSHIDLFVMSDNHQAIQCYLKAGFAFVPGEDKSLSFEDMTYTVKKMSFTQA